MRHSCWSGNKYSIPIGRRGSALQSLGNKRSLPIGRRGSALQSVGNKCGIPIGQATMQGSYWSAVSSQPSSQPKKSSLLSTI